MAVFPADVQRALVLQPPPQPLPDGVEVRRVIRGGRRVLVFSSPVAMASGWQLGFLGVMEDGFDWKQLPTIVAQIDADLT